MRTRFIVGGRSLVWGRLAVAVVAVFLCALAVVAYASADFSPDGKRVVAVVGNQVGVWDVASGRRMRTLRLAGFPIQGAELSPDGKEVVTTSEYGKTARIFDVETGQMLRTLRGDLMVTWAEFSPDGRLVAALDGDRPLGQPRHVLVWDAATGRRLRTLRLTDNPVTAEFSPDGKRIITGSAYGTASVWEARTGKLLAAFNVNIGPVFSAAFSPDGKLVAAFSSSGMGLNSDIVRIFDAANGSRRYSVRGSRDPVFSPDATLIATTDSDKMVRIREAATGHVQRTLHHSGGFCIPVFSPDGKLLVTMGNGWTPYNEPYKAARIWAVSSGRLLHTLRIASGVCTVEFSPDGKRLVTQEYSDTPQIWDVTSGGLVRTLGG